MRNWWRIQQQGPEAIGVLPSCANSETYLLLPLLHHLFGTDGHHYITDSDNFFARDGLLQLAIWVVTAALALGVTQLRQALAARTAP